MSNLFTVFVFVALSTNVQGATVSPFDDIVEAGKAGQWEAFQKLIFEKFGSDGWKEVKPGNVKDLKPPQGGHVYGESEYTFQSSSNFNGEKSEISAGHKIINNDGKVKEFDFKPENTDIKTQLEQSLKPLLNLGFKPEDFKPVDFKPEDFKPEDFKPVDFKPQDFKPEDFKPVDFKPVDSKPEDFKPAELKSAYLNQQLNNDQSAFKPVISSQVNNDKKGRSFWHI